MNSDFKVAIIIGLIILLLFWIFTLTFLLLRKPEKITNGGVKNLDLTKQ